MIKRIGALVCAAMMVSVVSSAAEPRVGIVFIGNSITAGATLPDRATMAPPAIAAKVIGKQLPQITTDYTNIGVSGSTTKDWTPAENKYFKKITDVADVYESDKGRQIIFSISLGTNDSASEGTNGTKPSKEEFSQNMRSIIDALVKRYPKAHFVINTPTWYSANTYNSARYLAEGQKRLKEYAEELVRLVESYRTKTNSVHLGDTEAWELFREQPHLFTSEHGQAGIFYLHPNNVGATKLGELWAKPLVRVIRETCPQSITLPAGAELLVFPAPGNTSKAVVILPGGGYAHLAREHEGTQVASWMNEQGLTAFVLLYQMPNGNPSVPNTDAQQAIEYARSHATELGGYTEVGIMGSSAGGHLASTVATHTQFADFQILLYPVITMKPGTHQGSHDNLIGRGASEELVNKFSNELRVSDTTPRAFIALSLDDKTVPALPNGIAYVDALTRNNIKTTLICYPTGGHGWGFRDGFAYSSEWKNELRKFLLTK